MGRLVRIIVVTVLIMFALRALRMIWAALTGGESVTARAPGAGGAGKPQRDAVPTSGVLRKCGHCGVYVSEALALKESSGGEAVFYCSADCRKSGRA